jgi:hypothetical protein
MFREFGDSRLKTSLKTNIAISLCPSRIWENAELTSFPRHTCPIAHLIKRG